LVEKRYLDAQELLTDSMLLGMKVLESGFHPTFIVAIWRGGAPVGIAVQEVLSFHGVKADHIAIRTSSYEGIDGRSDEVQVYSLNYLTKNITHNDKLLIVDDVFDTGKSIAAVIEQLRLKSRLNTPEDIRIAVPYYKPTRNLTGRTPDYYLHETEQWLKFPHSLEGLTVDEMKAHRPELLSNLAQAEGSKYADQAKDPW
jgi:hypoxanthine phosphoribosyltransferase